MTPEPSRSTLATVLVRWVLPGAVSIGMLAGLTPWALADDPVPGAAQVQQAEDHAAQMQSDSERLQARLDAATAALAHLSDDAEGAVEAYDGAVQRAAVADTAAVDARAHADQAAAAAVGARDELGRIAAASYRMGGDPRLGEFRVLFEHEGPARIAADLAAYRKVGRDDEEHLKQALAAAHDADSARTLAERTAREQRSAAEAVRVNRDRVQAALVRQQQQTQALTAEREQLLVQLAAARQTSLDLERARQEGLEAQAEQRRADEARKRAEAEQSQAVRQDGGRFHDVSVPASGGAAAVVAYARDQLGKPYVWGGAGPDVFDCSGLVLQAWRRAGVELDHFAATQYAESHPVSYAQLRPGDLIFWTKTGRAEDIHHVAIYIGDGRMIHAPHTGDVVKISDMFYMGTPDFYARPGS